MHSAVFFAAYFVTFFTKYVYSAFYFVLDLAFASLHLQTAISNPMDTILPVLLFVVIAAAVSVGLIILPRLVAPRRRGAVKEMPYESGMDPIHDTRRRFDVRFHLVAVTFLVFDVELLFLYPWAVASRSPAGIDAAVADGMLSSRGLAFAGGLIFILLVVVGFAYDWRKGVFRWR